MPVSMKYGKGADEMKANRFFVPLWSNPSPTSSFAAQTISIDLSAYSWFAVRAIFSISSPSNLPLAIFTVDEDGKRIQSVAGDTSRVGARYFQYSTTNKTMTFNAGYYNGSTNNSSCVPLEIYGVNL